MKNTISTTATLALATAAAVASGCWGPTHVDLGGGPGDAGTAPPTDLEESDLRATALEVPYGVHATWQGSPDTTLTFSWQTMAQYGYAPKVWLAPADQCGAIGGDAFQPAGEEQLLAGAGEPYATGGDPVMQWIVEATGLEPDTEYCYRVGTWDEYDAAAGALVNPRLGPVRRARTGLPRGTRAPFTFAVSGDTQGALTDLREHIDEIAATPAAFWLFLGDLSSTSSQLNWDRWFAAAAPLLDRAVAMPVRGNHEVSYGTFYGQFAMPVEPDLAPELAEHAWSFDYGNLHVVGLDSTKLADMEPIAEWLDADLAAADADPAIDWKVVTFHYPAYSASSHGCTSRVLEYWVPVFDAHGVDLVFSGHDHDFERTVPILNGMHALPGHGVTYIVSGGMFAPLYPAGEEWWTAYSEKTDNYVVVEVDGPTLRVTARDPNDQSIIEPNYDVIVDELLLQK